MAKFKIGQIIPIPKRLQGINSKTATIVTLHPDFKINRNYIINCNGAFGERGMCIHENSIIEGMEERRLEGKRKFEIHRDSIDLLKDELKRWNISKKKYEIIDGVLYTSDGNVIDVITESLDPVNYKVL